jgi:hypothetical protein
MINDFILKSMELNTATVNLKEFEYAILNGYSERIFSPSGKVMIDDLLKMK